jgi:hypothetical protein
MTLALLGLLGVAGYHERNYQRLARGLDADLAALRKFHWERPVLRGSPGEGNAADEIYAALDAWQPMERGLRDGLAEKLYYGQPLLAAETQALQARSTTLQALRTAVQQRWSRTDLVPELGNEMRVPAYPRLAEAALGLLSMAASAPVDECLQRATEVIRIGQDVVPAAPLEAGSVATQLTALAARVIVRCAQGAELSSLRRASHELHLLAIHPAPIGSCIEFEEIVAAMELRKRAALANKRSVMQVFQAVLDRPQLMAAWSSHDNPTRFRQLTPDHYPDAMEEWKREQDFRLQSSLPEVRAAAEHVLARIQDDMRGQALIRMLNIGLSTLAERAYRGTLPVQPSGLRDAALVDPFRGQPFNYRVAGNGAELTLWSVGEDYRDDGGSDDWRGSAPRDVTLHFGLGNARAKAATN